MPIMQTPQSSDGVFVLTNELLAELKEEARNSPLRRARICLHSDLHDKVQEMIIALCSDSTVEPHQHPEEKPESYHLIEGEMSVNIFNPEGSLLRVIKLHDQGPRFYRISGRVWHQPIATTDIAVYHEVYTGPFLKERDVIYARWERV